MTWIDEAGTAHPSLSDPVTAAGLEHIDHCEVCKQRTPKGERMKISDEAIEAAAMAILSEPLQEPR